MTIQTPRSEQGQTVEYSYGWHEGTYYMRAKDHGDGTVKWWYADDESADALADASYDAGGADDTPSVATWTECDDPDPSL